ncbi:MAG: serine hydrolase domain-containing protein [Pseudomonadota bacterium]
MKYISGVFLSLLAAMGPTAHAQQPGGPVDPAEFEAFVDGAWQAQKFSHPAAGAVVTLVKDGTIWLNKGYGYADLERQQPVDPARTLFRIASISKPFTWIAAMQLYEQRRLDLDADLNQYLTAFQLPARGGVAITMRHLMSHTAGFEDVVIDLGRRSADELLPLGDYLKDHLPQQVRPAGQFSSYSNHSTAIAAHVIEVISGQDWSTYLEQNILGPLDMQRTVARHPMPAALRADLAAAYRRKAGAWQAHEFLHWMIYPAGMMSTTGSDMAKFMQRQLAGGPPVLAPTTYQEMLTPLYRPFDGANAWLHGYVDQTRNNVRMYGHGGDLNGFHSDLVFFPQHNMAIFVAVNTDPSASFGYTLTRALVDHYFPVPPPVRNAPAADRPANNQDFHGVYGALRRSFSDFAKLVLLVDHGVIDTNAEGYLTWTGDGETEQYVAAGDDLFEARYRHGSIKFERNADGEVTHLHSSGFAASTMDKLTGVDNPQLHRALYAGIAIIALWGLFYWPRGALARSRTSKATGMTIGGYVIATLLCAAILYSLYALVDRLQNTQDVMFGIPASIVQALTITGWSSLIAGAFVPYGLYTVMRGDMQMLERSHVLLFTLAMATFCWLSIYWNVLPFLWR